MNRWFPLLLFLLFVRATAQAGEPERQRVRLGFAFASQLVNRRLTETSRFEVYSGDRVFRLRDPLQGRRGDQGAWQTVGLMSGDGVVELVTLEPFPVITGSQLIKVKGTRSRVCNINYVGPTEQSGIDSFTEGPQGLATDFVSNIGGGPWVGYLLAPELPSVEVLSKGDWASSGAGQVECRFGDRLIRVSFDVMDHDRPRSVEIGVAVKGLEKRADSYIHSRFIEFSGWQTQEDVEFPGEVSIWDLRRNAKTGWMTSHTVSKMVSVGLPVAVSQSYGEFFTGVSDGLAVQVDDYPGIDFIWQEGEIVRKVDGVKLAALIGQPFFGSPLRRHFMTGVGLCLLAAAGWLFWRRRNDAVRPTTARRRY